jgi:hypothetical protein
MQIPKIRISTWESSVLCPFHPNTYSGIYKDLKCVVVVVVIVIIVIIVVIVILVVAIVIVVGGGVTMELPRVVSK